LNEGRCFVCFQKNHLSHQCKSSYSCFKCGNKHHISICTDNKEKANNTPFVNNEDKAPAKEISTHTAMSDNNNNVLLQTASTEIFSSSPSNKINARLLFDTGSQRSYITKESKDKLNARTIRTEPTIIQRERELYHSGRGCCWC